MSTDKSQKIAKSYSCFFCYYFTSNKSDYAKHLQTDKHRVNKKSTEINEKSQKIANNTCFECNCGKQYKERTGLWRHKKKCLNDIPEENSVLVKYLMKENSELKTMILDVCKNSQSSIQTNSHNNNNNNSHNKTFNLQFFLNETCKDAMNIMDFVDSIKLQLSDLERVGEKGFVDGISNIIIKNLNDIDETKRPVHCTDKKREVMYVKDEDKWEKEDNENKKVRKAIKHVANKNIRMLNAFKEKHPDCLKSESKYSDKYNKIVIEAFGGSGETYDNETKIIKNLSKEVIINKNND
jgi:hypothetical protein